MATEKSFSADKNKPQILLIDDDPLLRRVILYALSEAGYEVVEAGSGIEGIARAQTSRPDLVLLDVMMPGMDGYEVCKHLRLTPATANVPIIILSALDQIDAKVRGLTTGADDFITKPFDMRELRTRVETHLRRSVRDLSASPLTGLPGNPMIEQTIARRIASREPLAVLYIDLTNFKAYNDEYGWLKGDRVIKLLANAILGAVAEFGTPSDFVGHVGGDDFIAISVPDNAIPIAQAVIDRFDAGVPELYSEETRARGYSIARDRRGRSFRAPIVSVAIAIVTNGQRELQTPLQVAAVAAEVKKHVKSHSGSHYAFDRRAK
ncbi:MAG: response regulator [Chloroflexota bacterium]|nr:response regulator [Chloroflexota bacterium]